MSAGPAAPARYAVIGHPVTHSLSPLIHAAFAAATGQHLVYDRLPCEPGAFAATVERFFAEGGSGLNVTLPFKGEAHALAARRSARADTALACNTLWREADVDAGAGADAGSAPTLCGDNTDGAGLVRDLLHNAGCTLAGARLLLVGAGGAAAGVVAPLLEAGVAELVVVNRTAARAASLVERQRRHAGRVAAGRLQARSIEACGTGYDVVVNATAASVAGAAVPVPSTVLRPGGLALDMMYGPRARPFLAWAEANGARGRDGLGMLVEQAAESFRLWRGVRPDTAPVLARLAMPAATSQEAR